MKRVTVALISAAVVMASVAACSKKEDEVPTVGSTAKSGGSTVTTAPGTTKAGTGTTKAGTGTTKAGTGTTKAGGSTTTATPGAGGGPKG